MSEQVHQHWIAWELEREDVRGTFTCTAPKGAPCRVGCAEGCEEACGGDPDTGEEHRQVDLGYCGILEWLASDRAEDYYAGEERVALRDGAIDPSWDGDGYVWDYAPAPQESDRQGDLFAPLGEDGA